MLPLLDNEPHNQKALNYDRFSNCGNECDSTPSSNHRRICGVQFSQNSEIHPIANRKDYTPEEVHACWYSEEEKSSMYDSCEKVVRRMEAGKRPKKNTTYRGLENFFEANSVQLDDTIHACIDAVMDEQERQWDETEGIDWDLFRKVSSEVSDASVSLAYRMAVYDEKEAKKAYKAMAKEQQFMDDASVCTNMTEVSRSTMVHQIKSKHKKAEAPPCSPTKPTSTTEKKKRNSRTPKSLSSGSRKQFGDTFSLLKKAYNTKILDRSLQSQIARAQ